MAFRAIIQHQAIVFPSMKAAIAWKAWIAAHEGTEIVIDEAKPEVSDNMRGYMFGAVIPFLKRLVPDWGTITDDQVYEILKKNFNYFEAFNPVTKRVERYGQSVMSKSNKNQEAMEFVQEIENWVLENYAQHLPDPEKFKLWKNSAPLAGEVYNSD